MQPVEQALHLRAAVFAVDTPLAQMLAIVAQEPIAILSKSGARAPHDFCALQAMGLSSSDPYRMSISETSERSLFHRSPVPVFGKGGVVHYGAAPHVDTMVCVGETRRHEVRTQRRLFIRRQQPVASAKARASVAGSRCGLMSALEAELMAKMSNLVCRGHLTLSAVHDGLVLGDT